MTLTYENDDHSCILPLRGTPTSLWRRYTYETPPRRARSLRGTPHHFAVATPTKPRRAERVRSATPRIILRLLRLRYSAVLSAFAPRHPALIAAAAAPPGGPGSTGPDPAAGPSRPGPSGPGRPWTGPAGDPTCHESDHSHAVPVTIRTPSRTWLGSVAQVQAHREVLRRRPGRRGRGPARPGALAKPPPRRYEILRPLRPASQCMSGPGLRY